MPGEILFVGVCLVIAGTVGVIVVLRQTVRRIAGLGVEMQFWSPATIITLTLLGIGAALLVWFAAGAFTMEPLDPL